MATPVTPGTDAYSMAELLAVAMSRTLADNDGEVGGVGAGATIPMAALRLATMTVAPNLYWFCGSSGGFNPTFDHLPLTSADSRALYGAEATQKMQDIVDMGGRGDWGFGFHGGMQIDRFGNANMIGIGPYEKLKVRGPGSVGLPWASRIEGAYLFTVHHSTQIFVEKVQHLSGPGWLSGGDSRRQTLPDHPNGPRSLFTPLCIMDFEEETRSARLVSVHPGHTVDEVVANTGFEIIIDGDVAETAPPSAHELYLLRNFIDRGGVLRNFPLTAG